MSTFTPNNSYNLRTVPLGPDLMRTARKYVTVREPKTVFRIFKKKEVEGAVKTADTVSKVQGLCTILFQTVKDVARKIRRLAAQGLSSKLDKTTAAISLPFAALDILTTGYSIYDDVVHLPTSLDQKDSIDIAERSANLSISAATLASSSLGIAGSSFILKGCATAALSVAKAGLGLGVVIFSGLCAIQAFCMHRFNKAFNSLKSCFNSSERSEVQYQNALLHLHSQINISASEYADIEDECGFDPNKIKKSCQDMIARKEREMTKRVGEDLTDRIKEQSIAIKDMLESENSNTKSRGVLHAKDLLNEYKNALIKNFFLSAIKFAGFALAGIGAGVALTTPIGSAVFFGVSSALLLYTWYKEKRGNPEQFQGGINLFGKKLFSFQFPEVEDGYDFGLDEDSCLL